MSGLIPLSDVRVYLGRPMLNTGQPGLIGA